MKKLKCPNCGSLKLRTKTLIERAIFINKDGECKFGKRVLNEEFFSLDGNRLFCGKCFKSLKYLDGVLIIK